MFAHRLWIWQSQGAFHLLLHDNTPSGRSSRRYWDYRLKEKDFGKST